MSRLICNTLIGIWLLVVVGIWLFAVSMEQRLPYLFVFTAIAYASCWVGFFFLSAHGRRENFMRLVAVSLSMMIVIALAEAVSWVGLVDYRIVFGRQVLPWANSQNLLDPQLIHIHRPHFRARGKMSGDLSAYSASLARRSYDVQYDQQGFRNRSDQSAADCVFIGDSFVEGANVRWDELHTTLIAKELGWTVANLGQAYYGPQQELIVFERYGLGLKPRVCIWFFFEGNDFADVWRYLDFQDRWPNCVANYHSRKERSFTKNSLLWLNASLSSTKKTPNFSKSGLLRTDDGNKHLWFGYAVKALSRNDLAALDVTVSQLERAYSKCRADGITLIVVYAPAKFRIYGDLCQFKPESIIQSWTVNDLPQKLQARLSALSNEIGFLDLTAHFKAKAASGPLLYYADDTHWSPAGHRLAAESICRFVRDAAIVVHDRRQSGQPTRGENGPE